MHDCAHNASIKSTTLCAPLPFLPLHTTHVARELVKIFFATTCPTLPSHFLTLLSQAPRVCTVLSWAPGLRARTLIGRVRRSKVTQQPLQRELLHSSSLPPTAALPVENTFINQALDVQTELASGRRAYCQRRTLAIDRTSQQHHRGRVTRPLQDLPRHSAGSFIILARHRFSHLDIGYDLHLRVSSPQSAERPHLHRVLSRR